MSMGNWWPPQRVGSMFDPHVSFEKETRSPQEHERTCPFTIRDDLDRWNKFWSGWWDNVDAPMHVSESWPWSWESSSIDFLHLMAKIFSRRCRIGSALYSFLLKIVTLGHVSCLLAQSDVSTRYSYGCLDKEEKENYSFNRRSLK